MVSLFRSKGQAQNTPTNKGTQLLPETMWYQEDMPSGIPPSNTVVVTISRQFGSGGSDIARLVAHESGLNYVDHKIIAEVARRLGVDTQQVARQDEQTAGIAGYIMTAIQSSSPFAMNYNNLLNPGSALAQSHEAAYLHLTQNVVLEMATQGNAVIVGRGAQFLLHNTPRILHIYIFAPLPYRIGNVMKEFHLNHEKARELIEQHDYEQSSYLRHYYGHDGQQPGLYHLLINTGLFSFDAAAQLILQALPIAKAIA